MVKFSENIYWHSDWDMILSSAACGSAFVLFHFVFFCLLLRSISYINQYALYLPNGKLSRKKLAFPFVAECPIQDQPAQAGFLLTGLQNYQYPFPSWIP